jgi:hypothetical protein
MSNVPLDRPATSRRPVHLWVVGILAFLWNSFGAFDYLATQLRLGFYMKQFSAGQLAYLESYPSWAIGMWALGVWGAFAGAIGLLLARRWAVWPFAVSLFGLAVNTVYNLVISKAPSTGGAGAAMMALIWVVAVALFVYAWRQSRKGVLR